MNDGGSFEKVLDDAIDSLTAGERVEAVLARYPRQAEELRPLLETVAAARDEGARQFPEMHARLADNFTIVRAAIEREQMAERQRPAEPEREERMPWWQRRLTFASVSLPAGMFALVAFLGIGGAAAASLAVGAIPSLPDVFDSVAHPGHAGDAPIVSIPTDVPAAPTDVPGFVNQPTEVTHTGTVSNTRGNTFTLTGAEGEFFVNIDGKTVVAGTIADGATVVVIGERTAEKNVHATAVQVIVPAPIASEPTSHPGPGRTPGPPVTSDNAGTQPDTVMEPTATLEPGPTATAGPEPTATPSSPGNSNKPPKPDSGNQGTGNPGGNGNGQNPGNKP